MNDPYSPALLVSALVMLFVARAAWIRRPATGALGLAVYCASLSAWSFVYWIQWTFTAHEPSLFFMLLRVVAVMVCVNASLVLVLEHTDRAGLLTRRTIAFLCIEPVVASLLIITDPYHHIYLGGNPATLRVLVGGPGLTLNAMYLYGLLTFALILLIRRIFTRQLVIYRLQTLALFVSLAFPAVIMLTEGARRTLVPALNMTPFAFTFSGILLSIALFNLGLLRIVPVARDRVIEQMQAGLIVFDADRRIVDVNPAARRMLGNPANLLGRRADDVLSSWPESAAMVGQCSPDSEPQLINLSTADCDLFIEVSASKVTERDNRVIATILMLRDVTQRESEERAHRDFVANASHELQTPLAALSLLGQTLERALDDDPTQVRQFVHQLTTETDRLIWLTNDLLDMSHLERESDGQDTREEIDLSLLAHEEAAEARLAATSKLLALVVDAPLPVVVSGEVMSLRAIIGNLLGNAIRYTPAGGNVTVSIHAEDDSAGSGWAVLTVSDDGIGIDSAEHERIFERFYRVDRARSRQTGGTGLGLSILRQAVIRHSGTVHVQSALGYGSAFTVRIPLA